MLPLLDVGQEARGVIAIGQVATGVIAIGQMATGVIAIGQMARGVIVVGMLGIGVVSFGMVVLGVGFGSGMAGLAGRSGRGWVQSLVPVSLHRYKYPATVPLAAIGRQLASGWLRVQLVYEDGIQFLHRGARLNRQRVSVDEELIDAAAAFAKQRGRGVARFQAHASGLVCDRIIEIPPSQLRSGTFWVTAVARLFLLIAACVAFWWFAGVPLGDALLGAAAN